jgi:hypothetical protein
LIVEGLLIPTDGTGGAFGYGILTEDGDAILVAHTHPGVMDSEFSFRRKKPLLLYMLGASIIN